MKARRLLLLLVVFTVASVAAWWHAGESGTSDIRTYFIYKGVDTDSTEQATAWFPCRGAKRIYIRTSSASLAFGANADSAFVDSIAVFKVLFSDSGGIAVATDPNGAWGPAQVAVDSTVITATVVTNVDTTTKLVGVSHPPLHEALRSAVNAGGVNTVLFPTMPGLLAASLPLADLNGLIMASQCRIRFTPRRRATAATSEATVQHRTNGIRKVRMWALVVYDNR